MFPLATVSLNGDAISNNRTIDRDVSSCITYEDERKRVSFSSMIGIRIRKLFEAEKMKGNMS